MYQVLLTCPICLKIEDFEGYLSRWDVLQVTNMGYMFPWCEDFESDLL
jgi:hypothetical protein